MNSFRKALLVFFTNLTRFIETKLEENSNNSTVINNLAPKTLTEKKEIERIQPYLNNLKGALDTDGINNIAITGSYGSGKSTVINTFQNNYRHENYEFLNISLASFRDNKESDNELDIRDTQEQFERRIEISILQQMFYKVEPSVVPESRFKRIVNISETKLIALTSLIMGWLFSGFVLFKFGYLESLNPHNWSLNLDMDWIALVSSLIFFLGVGVLVKNIYRLFKNSKINKLSIKGELELGESVDKSVFNQHLEEIIYFFERTKFNVVVIEDVDRFNSTDIFTKLREINILLNNSNLIKRPIKFLYAIKDEMFKDKSERVKFFEFIIPIIPFINPSNANDQLAKLIANANLEDQLSNDFTSDIVTFIDDIDMRLLINIFQEYQIYRDIINVALNQDKLFAILIYKNLYPDDFGDLYKRKGNLFKFLTEKSIYNTKLKENIKSQIEEIDNEIRLLGKEVNWSIKELRSVYINRIISKLDKFLSLNLNGDQLSLIDALEDEYFHELKKNELIEYTRYVDQYNYLRNTKVKSSISLSDVEDEISKDLSYAQREQLLIDRKNGRVDYLKQERVNLNYELQQVEGRSIREIFEQIEIDDFLDGFENSFLMRNLLLNGYIDEHYHDYISLFHEVSLTKSDFAFERSIKAGKKLDYGYELTRLENVVKRLPSKYFQREPILNYSLLNFLLENQDKFKDKLNSLLHYLSINEKIQFEFIFGFIGTNPINLNSFTSLLCSKNPGFWAYIYKKSSLPETEVNKLISLIFEFADLNDINNLEKHDSLISYLENLPNPLNFFNSINNRKNVEDFISQNQLQLKKLDFPDDEQAAFFEWIYLNNYYQINESNIELILNTHDLEYSSDQLKKANYSTLLYLDIKPLQKYIDSNIDEYISKVMIGIEENVEETEETILSVLNRSDISTELKRKVIKKQHTLIKSIEEIMTSRIKQIALSENKIVPNWQNICDYLIHIDEPIEDSKLDKAIIGFLNNPQNYGELCKEKLDSIQEASTEEEFIKEVSKEILNCNDLTDESYRQLLDSIPFTYNRIDYNNFDEERIDILLDKSKLSLSESNFDGLKAKNTRLSIRLIEVNAYSLVYKYETLQLDTDDWEMIFESDQITNYVKLSLIKKIDDEIIVDSKRIADITCEILASDPEVLSSFIVLKAIFKANHSYKNRISLLNRNFLELSNDEIQELVEILGGSYRRVFVRQNKPKFHNSDFNRELFNNLTNRSLIKRFLIDSKDERIKVIANY